MFFLLFFAASLEELLDAAKATARITRQVNWTWAKGFCKFSISPFVYCEKTTQELREQRNQRRLARALDGDVDDDFIVDSTSKDANTFGADDEHDELIGVAALKYFDLKHERTSNYKFDTRNMLVRWLLSFLLLLWQFFFSLSMFVIQSLRGNSAPYLL